MEFSLDEICFRQIVQFLTTKNSLANNLPVKKKIKNARKFPESFSSPREPLPWTRPFELFATVTHCQCHGNASRRTVFWGWKWKFPGPEEISINPTLKIHMPVTSQSLVCTNVDLKIAHFMILYLTNVCLKHSSLHCSFRKRSMKCTISKAAPFRKRNVRSTATGNLGIFLSSCFLSGSRANELDERRNFCRHIDIRPYFVRDSELVRVEDIIVKPWLIPLRTLSHKMVGDVLTKSLPSPAFIEHRKVVLEGKPERLDTHDENCTAGRLKVGKGRRRAFIVFRRIPLRILRGTQ